MIGSAAGENRGVVGMAGSYVAAFLFHRAYSGLPMLGMAGDAVVAIVLIGAGLAECLVPSLRAARVETVEVLRADGGRCEGSRSCPALAGARGAVPVSTGFLVYRTCSVV
ncbi:MAG TPA: hypothetical protein VHE61_08590 [Opitutaceae bacterium]|nr:hypothetical protein [Opitutaceae bacterium]